MIDDTSEEDERKPVDFSTDSIAVKSEQKQAEEAALLVDWEDLLAEDTATKSTATAGGEGNHSRLDIIMNIPVTISLEVGSATISIQNLLQLNQGSVVELDRLIGEPLDVLVNGSLVAHAEMVVVNEKFGIRLMDIISPAERAKKLS